MAKEFASGTKVTVAQAMEVPHWSTWDDDGGRISTPVKRRLQQAFFQQNKKVSGEIIYISKEDEREKLRRQGRCKIRVRDQSGATVVITAMVDALAQR